ncbi:translation initiation factor eIF-5A [Imleria badia]|nr:translation initiation factor eIF-5A [Imleria badia]
MSDEQLTSPMQCSALRKNSYVVIKGTLLTKYPCRPCRIIELTSQTGEDGVTNVHLVGIDVCFSSTSTWFEDTCPSTQNMDVPNVIRQEYTLENVGNGFLSLMALNGVMKDDIKIPEGDLGKSMTGEFNAEKELLVMTMSAMKEEHCFLQGSTKILKVTRSLSTNANRDFVYIFFRPHARCPGFAGSYEGRFHSQEK